MSNISLWQIEDSIIGLSEIIESPEASEEEKAAARAELERWTQEEVCKVDRVRNFLRHCQVMSDAAKFESDAMRRRGQQWEERGKRMKEIIIAAMQARGVKRLEGQSGVLRTQSAGGKQALVITNESLIPEEMCDTTVTFQTRTWQRIIERLELDVQEEIARKCKMARLPNNEAIRKALETPCAACGGSGIMGHIYSGEASENVPCAECNGTGRSLVPGAEFAPRGVSLRVE